MKFKIEHRFEGGSFEKAVHFLTEEYFFDMHKLPSVRGSKVLEEKITADTKYWKNQWSAYEQIPRFVQHLIKPNMFRWIEETAYDRKNKTYFTKITPFYFRSVFRCESRGYFVKKSDREFLRVQEGFLDIRIPIFGTFIEEQIIAHMKRNFDHEYRETFKVIKEKFGK